MIRFTWDARKDRLNEKKHGISFAEASSVFFDERGLLIRDPEHSLDEDRYLLLGMSAKIRILVVSHTYRDKDQEIRIISAWNATPQERQHYGRNT